MSIWIAVYIVFVALVCGAVIVLQWIKISKLSALVHTYESSDKVFKNCIIMTVNDPVKFPPWSSVSFIDCFHGSGTLQVRQGDGTKTS